MTHFTAAFDQIKFRGRDDDVSLNSATWNGGGGLNTDWSQDADTNFRVRFEVNETGGGSATNNYEVWFQLNAGSWTKISGTTACQWTTTTQYADLDVTTQVLGSATFLSGDGFDGSNGPTRNIAHGGNDSTELEICLTIDSAQVVNTDTIKLRVYESGSVIDAWTQEPTITVTGVTSALVEVLDETVNIAEDDVTLKLTALVKVEDETVNIAEDDVVDKVTRSQVAGPIIRPDGDISNTGGWAEVGPGSSLWEAIDEVTTDNDTSYIHVSSGVGKVCEVRLEMIADPATSANHQIFFRARRTSGSASTVKVELVENATVRASSAIESLTNSYQDFTYDLSAGEINSITDFDDLRLRFTGSVLTDTVRVTQAYFDTDTTGGGSALVEVEDEVEQIAEDTQASLTMVRLAGDTVNIAEGTPQRMAMTRIADETEEISEGTPHRKAMVRLADDDVNISEGILKLLGILRVVDEGVEVSEGVLNFKGIIQLLNETVNLAENVTRARVMVRVLDETENITETYPRLMNMVRLLNESGDITEDTIHTLAMLRIIDETGNITEATGRVLGFIRVIDEVQNITEDVVNIKGIIKYLDESVNLTEDVARARVMVRVLSEVEELVEGVVRTGLDYTEIINEIVNVTDSLLKKADHHRFSVIAGSSVHIGTHQVQSDVIDNKNAAIAVQTDLPAQLESVPDERFYERLYPNEIISITNYGNPLYTDVDLPLIQNDANVPDNSYFLYDNTPPSTTVQVKFSLPTVPVHTSGEDLLTYYVTLNQRVVGIKPYVTLSWSTDTGGTVDTEAQIYLPYGEPRDQKLIRHRTHADVFGLGGGGPIDYATVRFRVTVVPQGASGLSKRNLDLNAISLWLKRVTPIEDPGDVWTSAGRTVGAFEALAVQTSIYQAQNVPAEDPPLWKDKSKEESIWALKAPEPSPWTSKSKASTPWKDK